MALVPGQTVALAIERPAAGGTMIARAGGQIVLVAGAIPDELVTARVEHVRKGVAHARVVSVEKPSTDRREPFTDPLCGGCLYAHIAYPRQLAIKAQVIADAFTRIGKLPLAAPVAVAASPGEGYRMRARLHVRGGRIGFFREGTHDLCDARATRQLMPAASDVLDRLAAGLRSLGVDAVREAEISENVSGSERVVDLEAAGPIDARPLAGLAGSEGLTGLTLGGHVLGGDPHVTDVLSVDGRDITLRRHVRSFFQGNRFLLRDLVARVVGSIASESHVIDLYAGVGLFSIAAAVVRGVRVQAVEGDRIAAGDLDANARASGAAVEAVHEPVETFIRHRPFDDAQGRHQPPDVLIVDPPRTGMSREALDGTLALRARQIIYVSCDVATLARDSRRLVDAGYLISAVDAFDLFPNTPHVETVVQFLR